MEEQTSTTCKINRKFLPVKASFFFSLAAVGSLLPYMSVYMKQLRLSTSESGLIYGVVPFIGFLVRPITGTISDKYNKHKLVLIICCVATGVLHALLLVVPANPPGDTISYKSDMSLICKPSGTIVKYCQSAESTPQTCKALSKGGNAFTQLNCLLLCDIPGNHPLCLANSGNLQCITSNDTSQSGLSTSQPATAPICQEFSVSSFITDGSSHKSLTCSNEAIFDCSLSCASSFTFAEDGNICSSPPSAGQTTSSAKFGKTFWLFFFFYLAAQIPFAPVVDLITAMSYDMLKEQHTRWGKERLWGTVGFAAFGLTSGFIMDAVSPNRISVDYTYAFLLYLALYILTAVTIRFYSVSAEFCSGSMSKSMKDLLKRIDIIALLVLVFLFGCFTGVIEGFLFWHLSGLGAPQVLFGLCMVMNCAPEIPILFLAGYFIKKIGHLNCLYLSAFAYGVRFLCYSFLVNPWMVLLIEPLHGITFGLKYAAATSYACELTPPGMHGTVQGLIGGLHFGFGKGMGSALGGVVYEAFGPVYTFQGCAVMAGVVIVLYFLLNLLHSRSDRKPVQKVEIELSMDEEAAKEEVKEREEDEEQEKNEALFKQSNPDEDKETTKALLEKSYPKVEDKQKEPEEEIPKKQEQDEGGV